MDYKIPAENHGRLLVPDYSEIPCVVEQNDRGFENLSGSIAGIPLSVYRKRVHQQIANLLCLKNGTDKPIFMTAHQPGFWHPGILFKIVVAKRYAGKYFLLNLNVDSDVLNPVSFKVPFYSDDKYSYEEKIISKNEAKNIIEKVSKPQKEQMDIVFGEIEKMLSSLPNKKAARCFERFRLIHETEYHRSESLSHWLTNCRRKYFFVSQLHELDLSVICDTDEFRLFVWDMLINCHKLWKIYNSCLDRYRETHNIRYKVNPFPNLDIRTDGAVELPLWLITDAGTRETIFALCGKDIAISAETHIRDEKIGDAQALRKYQIRPKALVLTMFMRMFASSIFVHGVSGGNYDEVTDNFIREYFGCEPPEYIVASKTEFLLLGVDEDINLHLKTAKEELRNMQFNPDEYVFPGNPLVVEKLNIVMKSGGNTSKEEFMRLKEIRLILVKKIEQKIFAKEREIEAIELEKTKTERVRRRDFPYFFYPNMQLED